MTLKRLNQVLNFRGNITIAELGRIDNSNKRNKVNKSKPFPEYMNKMLLEQTNKMRSKQ